MTFDSEKSVLSALDVKDHIIDSKKVGGVWSRETDWLYVDALV